MYPQTKIRKKLQEEDKLGKNEPFEARIRGALGPYWTLVSLCDMDLEDPKIRELIKAALSSDKKMQDVLLELLAASEKDRRELQHIEPMIVVHYATEFGSDHSIMYLCDIENFTKKFEVLSIKYKTS